VRVPGVRGQGSGVAYRGLGAEGYGLGKAQYNMHLQAAAGAIEPWVLGGTLGSAT
jgi:hypothetical protein